MHHIQINTCQYVAYNSLQGHLHVLKQVAQLWQRDCASFVILKGWADGHTYTVDIQQLIPR